jgi:glycosyltransferase involved in cell wall biosynthesis
MKREMGPRRICMVVHGPYPLGEPRVAREATVAVRHGYSVEVIAMRRGRELLEETIEGVRVTRLPIQHVRGAGIGRVVFEYLAFAAMASGILGARSIVERYDIVQIHNPPDFLMVAAVFPRLLGSRIVFDVHDPSPEMFAMRFPGRAGATAGLILRRIERLSTMVADAVVTVHEPYRREMIARGARETKVSLVMNSLDEELLPPPAPRKKVLPRIVYHGTITPSYGVELLVHAAARVVDEIPDLRVEIIGEGDGVPELREKVHQLHLSNHVAIEGEYIPHREALARVNGASVGVVPNLPTALNRFALSSKLFEYVALGVPVVSADLPTIRAHFSADEIQFFQPGSAESLADALLAILLDPHRSAALVERARRRYQPYRWDVSAGQYLAILDHLSGRDGAPAIPVDPSQRREERQGLS